MHKALTSARSRKVVDRQPYTQLLERLIPKFKPPILLSFYFCGLTLWIFTSLTGRAKEFDKPSRLLERPSLFGALVQEYANRSSGL